MTIYFSAATGGFYDDAIHDTLPDDALEITADQHLQLLAGQSDGMVITADATGAPVLQPPSAPTLEQRMAQLRAQRDRLLRGSDWTQMPDSPLDAAAGDAWAVYRQTLRDLPQTIADPASVEWPFPPVA